MIHTDLFQSKSIFRPRFPANKVGLLHDPHRSHGIHKLAISFANPESNHYQATTTNYKSNWSREYAIPIPPFGFALRISNTTRLPILKREAFENH